MRFVYSNRVELQNLNIISYRYTSFSMRFATSAQLLIIVLPFSNSKLLSKVKTMTFSWADATVTCLACVQMIVNCFHRFRPSFIIFGSCCGGTW
jgi:hypothetical protein